MRDAKGLALWIAACALVLCSLPFLSARKSYGIDRAAFCTAVTADLSDGVFTVSFFTDCGVYSGSADTFRGAFEAAKNGGTKELFLGKTKLCLFSNSLSGSLREAAEVFLSEDEIRLSAPVVFCEGRAADVYARFGKAIGESLEKSGLENKARLLLMAEGVFSKKRTFTPVRLTFFGEVPVCVTEEK